MHTVLLVEDEARMREIVATYFESAGYKIIEASNGMEAIDIYEEEDIDLVLLDIMMPQVDGWTVCKRLRSKSDVPIIIITARSEDEDKLLGFDLGADDYVTKPFSPKVLVARADALLKRAEGRVAGEEGLVKAGNVMVNTNSREVRIESAIINLSPKEYDLLLFMMKNKNKVMTRQMILDQVWGFDYFGDLRTVDTHVKKLRSKMNDSAGMIKTIIRAGYMFEVK